VWLGAAPRSLAGGVFLLTLAVYLMTANGHVLGEDQEYLFRMAHALAQHGSFAIEPLGEGGAELGSYGVDGRFYSEYAPGFALALAPVGWVGEHLAGLLSPLEVDYKWFAGDDPDVASRFLTSYANAFVVAATAAVLAQLVLRLGYSPSAALFTVFAFAFATFAWGHARILFADPLQMLLLLVTCVLVMQPGRWGIPLGGAALFYAVLVKLTSLLALPAVLLLPDGQGRPLWRCPAATALVLAWVAIAVACQAAYNVGRFGSPLDAGAYGNAVSTAGFWASFHADANPWQAIVTLLFSPGRGLVFYAPPVLAAAVCARRFWRRNPQVACAFVALIIPWLAFHALYWGWDGGWGWGPRYLLPLLPFLLVPLAEGWGDRRFRDLGLALVAFGLFVQLSGATTDFMEANQRMAEQVATQCRAGPCIPHGRWADDFLPTRSDITTHLMMLLKGRLDLAWLTYAGTWVMPITFGLVACLAATGAWLLLPASATMRVPRPSAV